VSRNLLARRPAVPVAIELDSSLARRATKSDLADFVAVLSADLTVALQRLGLDGEALVSVKKVDSQRPIRIAVHGGRRPYSPALATQAWIASVSEPLRHLPLDAPVEPIRGFPCAWLRAYSEEPEADPELLLSFARSLVRAAILQRPSCLLGAEQIERYAGKTKLGRSDLESLLGSLLELGVSVDDPTLIADLVREGKRIGRPGEDTLEAVFAHTRSHVVEIHVHPQTLSGLLGRELVDERFSVYSSQVPHGAQRLFREMEQRFYERFGFLLPRLDWIASPSVREEMLLVAIDAWSCLPVPLLVPGERLVVEGSLDPKRHKHLPLGRPVIDPVTAVRCRVVHADKSSTDESGLASSGPIDFVVSQTLAVLADQVGRLLGMEEVEYQLARLHGAWEREDGAEPAPALRPSPNLVRAVLSRYSLGELTRLLRAFVAEGISIANLAEILDRLLEYDTIALSPEEHELVVVDDRVPRADGGAGAADGGAPLYEFARKQLRPFISFTHTWGESRIVAYVLEPELEAQIAAAAANRDRSSAGRRRFESFAEAFRDTVWEAIQVLAPAPAGQVVVTSPASRQTVRSVLAAELPDLPVLARSELSRDVTVRPLARIGVI
jgi:hypothetical protein